MEFLHNFAVKLEKDDYKSDEDKPELDFMVDIEIKSEEFIKNYYDEKPYVKVENGSNINENSSEDGSFSSLQEFYQEECMVCQKVFFNRYNFIKHSSKHLEVSVDFPKTYQCDYCSVFFMKKSKLTDHIYSTHSEENNNIPHVTKRIHHCSICQKQFKYRHWKEHMNSVHCTERFECSICNVDFKCLRYLKKHNRVYHEGVIRKQDGQRNLEPNKWNLKKYQRQRKPGPFKCKLCPETFRINDCLNKHVLNCHGDPVECKICKSKLKSSAYLKVHMNREHYNDGKLHKCEICSKQFKSPRYVRIHIQNTHAKLDRPHRPYKTVSTSCECGESFSRVRMLEEHLKICAVSLKLI